MSDGSGPLGAPLTPLPVTPLPPTLPPEMIPPELRFALALEHNAKGVRDLAEELGDLREAVAPAMRMQTAALTAQTAAWNACSGVGAAAKVVLETFAALFRGWWGGPLALVVLALITALSLAWTGWGPVDVTRFVVAVTHAARGDAAAAEPPPAGPDLPEPVP